MGLSQFDEHSASIFTVRLDTGNDIDPITLVWDTVNMERLDRVVLTSDDSIDHTVKLFLAYPGGDSSFYIGSVLVPSMAGFDATVPAVEVFTSVVALAGGLVLVPNTMFGLELVEALNAGKFLYATSFGGTF